MNFVYFFYFIITPIDKSANFVNKIQKKTFFLQISLFGRYVFE